MMSRILLGVSSALLITCVACFNEADYFEGNLPVGVNVPEYVEESADPQPCCLPKQWQGNITTQSGMSGGRMGGKYKHNSNLVFVDETNKRVAGRGVVGCHRNETGAFIMLFGANKTAKAYFFIMESQKCWKKDIKRAEFRPQCIPKNATHIGDFSLGPASGGLNVQGWEFRVQKGGERGRFYMGGKILVIPDKCVPVYVQDHGMFSFRPGPGSQSQESDNKIVFDQDDVDDERPPRPRPGHHGHHGMGFLGSAYFANVEDSIKDPSVFTPPSYCNTTVTDQPVMDGYEDFSDLIDRFVSFM